MRTILVLCLIGIVLSGYLTYLHYQPQKLDTSFCNLNDFYSCSTVNKSSYATLFSIPVSIIGMIGFAVMAFLSIKDVPYRGPALVFLSTGAVAFMSYLTTAELFIIKAICVLCVAVALTTLMIFGLSAYLFGRESIDFIKNIEIVED